MALGQSGRNWNAIAVAPNGNVYAGDYGGDIYMQTHGTGAFVALNQTSRSWVGMAAAPNGNVYAINQYNDIYMQTAGTGDFLPLGETSRDWSAVAVTPNGNVYASVYSGDIYEEMATGAGNGSDAGSITVASSTLGLITANGGRGGSQTGGGVAGNGGNAGSITFTTSGAVTGGIFSLAGLGGAGSSGAISGLPGFGATTTITDAYTTNITNTGTSSAIVINADSNYVYGNADLANNIYVSSSTLAVNYTNEVVTTASTTLSSLNDLIVNGNDYGSYPGGPWPIFPGTVSTCGTIGLAGTYTLGNNLFASSTCLNIITNNITIEGAGYSITGDIIGSGYNFTIDNAAVIGNISSSGNGGETDVQITNVNDLSGLYFYDNGSNSGYYNGNLDYGQSIQYDVYPYTIAGDNTKVFGNPQTIYAFPNQPTLTVGDVSDAGSYANPNSGNYYNQAVTYDVYAYNYSNGYQEIISQNPAYITIDGTGLTTTDSVGDPSDFGGSYADTSGGSYIDQAVTYDIFAYKYSTDGNSYLIGSNDDQETVDGTGVTNTDSVGNTYDTGSFADTGGGSYQDQEVDYTIYAYHYSTDGNNYKIISANPMQVAIIQETPNGLGHYPTFGALLSWADVGADGYVVVNNTTNSYYDVGNTTLFEDDGSAQSDSNGWNSGDISSFGYDDVGSYTYNLPFQVQLEWNGASGADGYFVYNETNGYFMDVGNTTSITDDGNNINGTPWYNGNNNYPTTYFNFSNSYSYLPSFGTQLNWNSADNADGYLIYNEQWGTYIDVGNSSSAYDDGNYIYPNNAGSSYWGWGSGDEPYWDFPQSGYTVSVNNVAYSLNWNDVGADGYIVNDVTDGYYLDAGDTTSTYDDGSKMYTGGTDYNNYPWVQGSPTLTPSTPYVLNLGGGSFNGGPAGDITFTNSSLTGAITANGGDAQYGTANNGGAVTIASSTLSGLISSNGGSGQTGGNGGDISVTSATTTGSDLDFTGDTLTANPGSGGTEGTITASSTGSVITGGTNIGNLSTLTLNGTAYSNFSGGSNILLPGKITACGNVSLPGSYSLLNDISNIAGTCFTLAATSTNVTIEGNTHTLSASNGNTNYAIDATAPVNAHNGVATTTVNNLLFQTFTKGITANGANNGGGPGKNGGAVVVSTSTIPSISANGGNGTTRGGNGGTIITTKSIQAASSTTLAANGGSATVCGYGGSGGVVSLIQSLFDSVAALAGFDETDSDSDHCNNGHPSGSPANVGTTNTTGSYYPPAPQSGGGNTTVTTHVGGGGTVGGGALPSLTLPINPIAPLNLAPLPTFGDTGSSSKDSFSFIPPITAFLFAPLPNPLGTALKSYPDLKSFLSTLHITYAQDLVTLNKKPVVIPTATSTAAGIYYVSNANGTLKGTLVYDKNYQVLEKVTAPAGGTITVGLITGTSTTGTFAGSSYSFKSLSATRKTLSLILPTTVGRYYLTTNASPLTLAVDVVASTASVPKTSTAQSFFTGLLHFFNH